MWMRVPLLTLLLFVQTSATAFAAEVEFETARPGSDYRSGRMMSDVMPVYALCRDECAIDARCLAWMFVYDAGQGYVREWGTCYLKDAVPDPVPAVDLVVSGTMGYLGREPPPPPPPPEPPEPPNVILGAAPGSLEPDTNRPGGDYVVYSLPIADPGKCQVACQQDARCRAWTYVNPGIQGAKARCWLKSTVPHAVADSCCVSGVR